MATIDRREGKLGVTWRARVRVNGQTRVRSFKRKKDATQWATKVESHLTDDGFVPTTQDRKRTVDHMIDRYLADLALEQHPSSNARNKIRQLNWWKSKIGGVPIVAVDPALLVEYRDELFRTRSAATVNRYLADLSAVFKIARKEWRWTTKNPVSEISTKKEPRGRTRCLTDDERDRLLKACRNSSNPALYPVVLMALSTAMRKGEILGLAWDDVDLVRQVVITRDTKNGTDRSLALRGPALEALQDLSHRRRNDSDLVFPGKSGRHPLEIKKPWYAAVEEAEIENFRFHDLRHTAARYLLKSKASLGELAEVLGHRTLDMVKRYTDSPDDHTVAVVERMNKEVFGGT